MQSFNKLETETNVEYIQRAIKLKHHNRITWHALSEIINENLGLHYCESYYRKGDYLRNPMISGELDSDSLPESIKVKMEKVKASDIMRQTNSYIRKLAREDTFKEIALEAVSEISTKKLLPNASYKVTDDENQAILQLSDWHYGIEVDTFLNKFNPEICRARIAKLCSETIAFCKQFKVHTLHITNLSDLICGRIHLTLRLESRMDVITQIMHVSEILSEFIAELTANGIAVEYYDCLDNHSRLEPNKKDSLDLESLVRIVPWYLRERLVDNDLVKINDNVLDDELITFEVLGHPVAGVHGHKDHPAHIVDGLTLLTKHRYELILTAHRHHFMCDEKNEVLVVGNGSLMGTDYYAKDYRLSSVPSQNLILVTKDNVAKYIYRVELDKI